MLSFQRIRLKWQTYYFKLFGRWRSCPLTCPVKRPHHKHIFWSWFGSCVAVTFTAYLTTITQTPLIMAPFGATSILVFGMPDSPLSQPRNVIGGNLVSSAISLLILHIFGASPLSMGVAVATAMAIMQLTRTLHPPSGGVALVVMLTKPDWQFLIAPTLQGSLILVFCAVIFNNLAESRTYPQHWL